MNFGQIYYCDTANGIGVRTVLFVSGCRHQCPGCFNAMAWDFNYGQEFTKEMEDKIIESLKPAYIAGLSVLGGEPWEVENQEVLYPFLKRVKEEVPGKTIWTYSGFLYEELTAGVNDAGRSTEIEPTGMEQSGTEQVGNQTPRCVGEHTVDMLALTDVLVDGKFEMELKDISLKFRGSSNQRIIDVKKSLEEKQVVLLDL